MSEATQPRVPDETGVPDPFLFMHPTMKRNYANWDWHERLRPGVLHHMSKTGESIYTVRAGTQRQMDVYTIRKLCDIADEYADGHFRFTTRSNIEYMVDDRDKIEPLIEKLVSEGFPCRWHRKLRLDDLAHPGLVALRYPGHRRVRRRQKPDGYDV